jgi:hypothetical protein
MNEFKLSPFCEPLRHFSPLDPPVIHLFLAMQRSVTPEDKASCSRQWHQWHDWHDWHDAKSKLLVGLVGNLSLAYLTTTNSLQSDPDYAH